jgi:hypothetical protein
MSATRCTLGRLATPTRTPGGLVFHLVNRSGERVLMRDGRPFTYTHRWQADLAAGYIEGHRHLQPGSLTVRSA